jgi:ferredoxin
MSSETPFEQFLKRQDEEAWSEALATLRRSIHEVDRNATQVWFSFYPLSLFQALQAADDRLARQLLLQGDWELKNQIDSSHHFLYGHRFWPQVKKAVEEQANAWDNKTEGGRVLGVDVEEGKGSGVLGVDSSSQRPPPNTLHPNLTQTEVYATSLADQIIAVAKSVAGQLKKDESLLVGITAVAFMTVQQVGFTAFTAAPGEVNIDRRYAKKSPEQVLRDRARDDWQGLLGFLKTVNKQWTVTWDENDKRAKYKLREGQDLAWGAAGDQSRDWRAIDSRRIEGPIPVECRSASCGTCWVGVLGGAEKLSDVGAREGKKIKEFGYIDTAEPKPLIRLACQAQPQGAVSIVIPPWNGQFGKYLRSLNETKATAISLKQSDDRAEMIQ